jgi:N-acyl-phosphatidylethanolamine-hydrolysing phospholipase D
MLWEVNTAPTDPDMKDADEKIGRVKPDFGSSAPKSALKATWLGHACVLVEMPSDNGRGVTILFDPVFSQRCSPST